MLNGRMKEMARRKRLTLAAVAALTALLLLACSGDGDSTTGSAIDSSGGSTPVDQPIAAPLPDGLPSHLGLGLMNNPLQIDWMTGSGVAWDYRYQYLTGGVNTGDGWTTWGYPAGSFVDQYLQDSADSGYIPVFSYYQVVASAPDPGGEEVALKLRDVSTMRDYYADWEGLMRRLGTFGKPVIVHVEPDLWGYMQLDDDDAAMIEVQVKSSGAPSVGDFDDTAAGFARALVYLRDEYAPNVLLGFHVSSWASGKDLTANKADPAKTADKIAGFYRSLGVEFDLLFVDASDRDAGWYKVQRAKDTWWEESDFERHRAFVRSMVVATGKRAVIWQAPVGNTVYRSMDNSWGHYQDNRAQYWLGDRAHMQALADAGVVAVLFGAGADGCTMYDDSMRDGVTNPAPINGNEQEAQYADDDGGYLRLYGGEYYRSGPIALSAP